MEYQVSLHTERRHMMKPKVAKVLAFLNNNSFQMTCCAGFLFIILVVTGLLEYLVAYVFYLLDIEL